MADLINNGLISKQDVDVLIDSIMYDDDLLLQRKVWEVLHRIQNLPPIKNTKTGRWVPGKETGRTMIGDSVLKMHFNCISCSNCEEKFYYSEIPPWNYCPKCGAKMESKQ